MSALPPSSGGTHFDVVGPPGALRTVRMESRHHAEVLALNEQHVAMLSPMDQERLDWILARCAMPLVVEDDDGVLGFCLALERGSGYDGAHYAWFAERYGSFLYLDRIAVSERARRRGVGSRLYGACEDHARTLGRMLCEVNVVPMNATSMAFHRARGYVEVARRPVGPAGDEGSKVVAMLAKDLPPASPAPG